MKILVTCPPMLGMIEEFIPFAAKKGLELVPVKVTQTLSEEELINLLPQYEGWIIGDDPATRRVFEAGKAGKLKAAVKWGIGVDNVDFAACKDLGIPITNTPNMFGGEVADIAVGYVIALARQTFEVDKGVRNGDWPKPCGISLAGKTVALVGYGDIGKNTAKRLLAADMRIIAYDPVAQDDSAMPQVQRATWPDRIAEADFIIITCALTNNTKHMLNAVTLPKCKPGVRIVNVGRGPVIDELALETALECGLVYSAALDVYEQEPLPLMSFLRSHPRCVFGSHNASNTKDAVIRASEASINKIISFLSDVSLEQVI